MCLGKAIKSPKENWDSSFYREADCLQMERKLLKPWEVVDLLKYQQEPWRKMIIRVKANPNITQNSINKAAPKKPWPTKIQKQKKTKPPVSTLPESIWTTLKLFQNPFCGQISPNIAIIVTTKTASFGKKSTLNTVPAKEPSPYSEADKQYLCMIVCESVWVCVCCVCTRVSMCVNVKTVCMTWQ